MQMPLYANIPAQWVKSRDDTGIVIVVPSWEEDGGNKTYDVAMNLRTRELACECKGYQFRNDCHHLNYLVNFCKKPLHPHKIGVQQTSVEAFKSIQKTLSDHQAIVCAYIEEHGPVCDREIAEGLGWTINKVTARRNEDWKMDLIRFAGTKLDSITNRTVMTWRAV